MHLKDDELASRLSASEGLELLAAAYARVTTAVSFTRLLSPLGNYLIARPAARAAARTITEQTDVPLDAAVVLALSPEALHVWSADPMMNQVGDYLGQVPIGRITAITVTPDRSWQKVAIALDGGHEVDLEARGPVYLLAEAFRQQRGLPAEH